MPQKCTPFWLRVRKNKDSDCEILQKNTSLETQNVCQKINTLPLVTPKLLEIHIIFLETIEWPKRVHFMNCIHMFPFIFIESQRPEHAEITDSEEDVVLHQST